MERRVIESAATLWRDDINYPGVPAAEPGPGQGATRTTTRATVDHDTFVLRYTTRQVRHVMLSTTGVGLIVLAVAYIEGGPWLALLIALGIGAVMAGGAGFIIAADAHATYTRHFALTTTHTYTPQATGPQERPFVASTNAPATIRVGRFSLARDEWRRLFSTANDSGRLTRDGAARVLPRDMYRDWQTTVGELARLGIVDDDGRITDAGWELVSPSPTGPNASSGAHSTHARRTVRAHGDEIDQWGGA